MYHVIVGVQTYQKYLKDDKILIYQFSFCRKSVECLIKKYETRIPTYIYEMLWFFSKYFISGYLYFIKMFAILTVPSTILVGLTVTWYM